MPSELQQQAIDADVELVERFARLVVRIGEVELTDQQVARVRSLINDAQVMSENLAEILLDLDEGGSDGS